MKELAAALRRATGRSELPAREIEAPGVLAFDRGGALLSATRNARALVAAIPSDARHGGPPHAIASLSAAATARRSPVRATVGSRSGLLRVVALPESSGSVVIVDGARTSDVVDAAFAREGLTARERDVCRAMLRGLSDKEIASSLDVGIETVKAHARASFAKLSVRGRGGLLAKLGL